MNIHHYIAYRPTASSMIIFPVQLLYLLLALCTIVNNEARPLMDPASISSTSSTSSSHDIGATDSKEAGQLHQECDWLGISDSDVEDLVQQVIRDPTINIASIPDFLEIHMYRSTIKVVLNALYQMLGKIHGAKIAYTRHEIQLKRHPTRESRHTIRRKLRHQYQKSQNDTTEISDDILEEVAEGLLSNRNINQRFLPDVIEKKLYVNCLKLIFRLLEMLADSVKVTVCGHDLQVAIFAATTNNSSSSAVETALESATLRMSEVDRSKLYQMAKSAGLNETGSKTWWLSRKKQEFLQTLHASLLGLLLAILDDLMHKTCIELFSDRMVLDIVPSSPSSEEQGWSMTMSTIYSGYAPVRPRVHRFLSFVAGIGVGALCANRIDTLFMDRSLEYLTQQMQRLQRSDKSSNQ